MTTPVEAVNDIGAMLRAYWQNDETLRLPGKDEPKLPATKSLTNYAWLRISHISGEQASLSDTDGKRSWQTEGIGSVELYTPIELGVNELYRVADEVVKVYRGKRSANDVWFRNVSFQEVPYQSWLRIDVTFDFEYTDYH